MSPFSHNMACCKNTGQANNTMLNAGYAVDGTGTLSWGMGSAAREAVLPLSEQKPVLLVVANRNIPGASAGGIF